MKFFYLSVVLMCVFLLVFLILKSTGNMHKTATIAFMGDVMLGRLVNEILQEKPVTHPWGNTLSLLQKADLRIINLENTFTLSNKAVPKVFNFKSDPNHVQSLVVVGIDVVNILLC